MGAGGLATNILADRSSRPVRPAEGRQFHLTEGTESFRRKEYGRAAEHFELARIEDPTDTTATLALVGAYERLEKRNEAVTLLEGLLSGAQQRKLDDKEVRMLARRLALNHVAGGKEEAAYVVLLRNGITADEARRFIATARSTHSGPR